MQSTVFLDRDGVIIENREDCIKSWSEMYFLPEALAALRRLSQTAHALVLVTNQSAIGRSIITIGQAVEINRRVTAEIEFWGGRIDAWYMGPITRRRDAIAGSRCRVCSSRQKER